MIGHNDVQLKLYEFLQNEIPPEERALIEAHLAACDECAHALRDIQDTLVLLRIPSTQPSSERSEQFWNAFPSRVVEKANAARRSLLADVGDWVRETFLLQSRYAYVCAGAVTLGLAAVAFWTLSTQDNHELLLSGNSVPFTHTAIPVSSEQEEFGVPAERVNQYFRKSKTLLVGLVNLRADENEPLDFSTERRVSRDLIRESRFLKQQQIDPQSRRLMNDLEKILIELANIEEQNDLPNVEIVRGGIRQENLLFKIRMAEAMYDSSGFVYAHEQR